MDKETLHNLLHRYTLETLSFNSKDLWVLMIRYWKSLLGFLAGGVFVALMVVLFAPRVYEATAVVILEPRKTKVTESDDVVSGVTPDATSVLSEVEVIRSRGLIQQIATDWGLEKHKVFNPDSEYSTWPVKVKQQGQDHEPASDSDSVSGKNSLDDEISANETSFARRRAVDELKDRLSIHPRGRSLAIEITMKAPHPDMASDLANALADAYIDRQLKLKKETAHNAKLWLGHRLDELEKKVHAAAQAVETYRSENNLINAGQVEITSQQITEITSQLVQAKARVAEASARLDRVQEAVRKKDGLAALTEVVASPLIQRLRHEESALLRSKSELETRYGDRHPKIINIRAELKELHRKIDIETDKVVDNIKSEMEIAKAGLKSLEESLEEQETKKEQQNIASIELSQMEQELASTRDVYETTLKRYKEVSQQADMQRADSRVISYADPPTMPVFPKPILMIFLGLILGGILGALYVFIREQFDYAFRTPAQLEKSFGLPVWGMVPKIKENKTVKDLASHIINKPYSAAAESIRSMRVVMAIKKRSKSEKGRVISITSAIPGEGKTTVSVWLSRMVAMSGKKVLLIDCDLRCPKVHESFGRKSVVSLIDVLTGQKRADELIEKDTKTGLHIIMGKSMQQAPFDLLTSEKMDALVTSLKENYDLIVLDTPPTLTMADSRFLSRLAGDTLFVVQWNKTQKDAVASAMKMYQAVDLKISAFVLNKVDLKAHAKYHYNDTGSYYAKYPNYFSDDQ